MTTTPRLGQQNGFHIVNSGRIISDDGTEELRFIGRDYFEYRNRSSIFKVECEQLEVDESGTSWIALAERPKVIVVSSAISEIDKKDVAEAVRQARRLLSLLGVKIEVPSTSY